MKRLILDRAIGWRLSLGFVTILLLCFGTLAGAIWTTQREHDAYAERQRIARASQAAVGAMRDALLRSGIAVRNMGLQTTVETMEQHQASAKSHRARYVESIEALRRSAQEPTLVAHLDALSALDAKMQAEFGEAVGLASQFNPEQAAEVIAKRFDPLSESALKQLDAFAQAQLAMAERAEVAAKDKYRQALYLVAGAVVLSLLVATAIARALTVGITRPLHRALLAVERVARGDLTVPFQAEGKDEISALVTKLEVMRTSLSGIVSEVRSSADGVSTGMTQIAQGNADLSHRTEVQAGNLQESVAAMEQISVSVKKTASAAQTASEAAHTSLRLASEGGAAMTRVVQSMGDLQKASERIDGIVGVIDAIAFQTNLLALNAAVEAARAGDQGRGFSVVASEVRMLAGRSSEAAKEIRGLVQANRETVLNGGQYVADGERTMGALAAGAEAMAASIATVARSASAQASDVAQLHHAITQIDTMTQQNAALVEQAAAATQHLDLLATRLASTVQVFEVA